MTHNHGSGCLLCGAELSYSTEARPRNCSLCQREFESEAVCLNGHFVCDECHSKDALGWIEKVCLRSAETDPIHLANTIMASPLVKMHGPEHHFLVPAVLVTAVFNHLGRAKRKSEALVLARKRSHSVLGGYCGFQGACGAAIGTGIAISILMETRPVSVEEWKLSNQMTARALGCIAEKGGPRCCKRDSFIAIREAVDQLSEAPGIRLVVREDIYCGYSEQNKECLTLNCDFYNGAPA